MQPFAEDVLGHGTPIPKEIASLMHGLGADDAHLSAITDPQASRQARMDTRRERPDSPMSDVPDRFALFDLLGNADLMAWPDLGTAIDDRGRIAAHLRDCGRWVLVNAHTEGTLVIDQLASGGHVVRVLDGSRPELGSTFLGPDAYLAAVRRARLHIERAEAEQFEPQDRG